MVTVSNVSAPWIPAEFGGQADPSVPADDPWSSMFELGGRRPLVQSMAYASPVGGGTSATPPSYEVGKTGQL